MADPKVIHYPIPGNESGGVLHVYGNPSAKNVVLYCGGFPDDNLPFTPLARRLASKEAGDECFVGITCFPGFDYSVFEKDKYNSYRKRGYSFDDVAICIREAAAQVFKEYYHGRQNGDKQETPQFTCIFHDWGVVAGSIFTNRALEENFAQYIPDKVVLLDVLMGPHPKYNDIPSQDEVPYSLSPSIYSALIIVSYQSALASAFFMLTYFSELLGVITLSVLIGVVIALRLNPTKVIDNTLVEARNINPFHLVYMAYPYFYTFRNIFLRSGFEQSTMPLDLKKTPILYIFGSEKNVMFHDLKSLATLEREEKEGRSACRVVKMEKSGHWMYVQKSEECLKEIKAFMEQKNV